MNLYLQLLDRLQRLAEVLGLERRQKRLAPLDAVRAAVERANQ